MKSINKNFMYNSIYQLLLYIIPIILTPYISRTLGADNIGIYSYTYSIVYYFMLITMLGINNYGSREIAKCSDDKEKLSSTFSSIYNLQLKIGLLMIIIYNIIIAIFMKEYYKIAVIHNFFLLSAILDINWLFFGLEEFKVTVTRNIIIKMLSLVLIFVFVKCDTDLWKYTLIMSVSTFLSQVYLFIILKKYTSFKVLGLRESLRHLKGCALLFIPVLAYSIYRVMDKTMIGYLASTYELGLYENAEKIINIPISFLTAMGTVMIPYMSKKMQQDEDINSKIMPTFEMCFCFISAMAFGLLAVANDFSIIYFGSGFEKCGLIIKILVPSIFFTSIANVIRTNYLIPFEKDKVYVCSTALGAVVNLILNSIFIKRFGAIGACIGTIVAEFTVMMYQLIKVRKDIKISKMLKLLLKYLIKGVIMYMGTILVGLGIHNIVLKLFVQIIVAIILYVLMCRKYILYDFLGRRK